MDIISGSIIAVFCVYLYYIYINIYLILLLSEELVLLAALSLDFLASAKSFIIIFHYYTILPPGNMS